MTDNSTGASACSTGRRGMRTRFGRRGWTLLAAVPIGVGLGLNREWLTEIGLAPILLGLAPCAAMCALGLCMKGGGKTCTRRGAKEIEAIARPSIDDVDAHPDHERTNQ